MEWSEDYEDEYITEFLDMMYDIHIKKDSDFPFSRKEFYSQFYYDLASFKEGDHQYKNK